MDMEKPSGVKSIWDRILCKNLLQQSQDLAPALLCLCQVTEFLLGVLPDMAGGISDLNFSVLEKGNVFTQILPTALKQDRTNVHGGGIETKHAFLGLVYSSGSCDMDSHSQRVLPNSNRLPLQTEYL